MTAAPGFNEALAAFQKGDLARAREAVETNASLAGSASGQHLLGLIYCRLGDLKNGVERLRLASEAEPDNVGFRVMLARALIDSGQAADALAVAIPPAGNSPPELALWHARAEATDAAEDWPASAEAWALLSEQRPGDWRAWNNLGNAHAAQSNWAEAAEALSKAADINPGDINIHRNAGWALVQAKRVADAIRHFQIVASAEPNDAENRTMLAHALAAAQRHEDAIAEYEAAKTIGGATVATELGRGRSLASRLRNEEAEEAFRRAYAIEPANRAVVHFFGTALERNNKLDEVSRLLEEALASGLAKEELSYLRAVLARRQGRLEEARELLLQSNPDEDPISWYRLKAKIADSLGNTAEAFEASEAMNRIGVQSAMGSMDPEEWRKKTHAYRQEQHELARTITPEWAAGVPLLNEPTPKRVAFLVGFPRSGTTLLDTFLMGHPEVTVLEEEQLVGRASGGFDIKALPTASIDFIRKARATYLAELEQRVGRDFDGLVIDKFPLDMAMAPFMQAMFPGAPIIFAQRHPCDVVLSGFMQSFGIVNFADIRDAADYYDAMMSIWTAARDAMKLNTTSVVYEELVEDPEAALRPVIDFLGLEWDERLLDHRRTAKERGAIVTPSYDQVTEPITKKASGRWKRYREQMEPVLPILLPWAETLGYRD